MGSQGGSCRERSTGARRTTLLTAFDGLCRVVRGLAKYPVKAGADGEVVWFRRPDAGVKFCGDACHPTGWDESVIRETTVANKPVTGKSTK
jgi:hypothetical protein